MIEKLAAAGLFAAATIAAPVAFAGDFPATPLQHGAPRDLPGEKLIPGAELAVDVINGVTQPILQPILAPGGEAAPAAAPAARKHEHHHAGAHRARHPHVAVRKARHKAA